MEQILLLEVMPTLSTLSAYSDDQGNTIDSSGVEPAKVNIVFRGGNNTLIVSPKAKIAALDIRFDCDNAVVKIGANTGVPALRAFIRAGQDSSVLIGDNVSTTRNCNFIAVEGTVLTVGDDVMIASSVEIRTDDAHPIFDVVSGERLNKSKDVTIGNHVWLANQVKIRPGTVIGDGSVVGMGSIVKGVFPNNCIVVGAPAKVVRKNVAWERPHLSLSKPYYKPNADSVKKSAYWDLTND